MQSMGCHGVSEQLVAAGATEADVKKISQVMAQTVRTLETGIATPKPGPEAHSLPCEAVGSDEEFSNEKCISGFSQNGHRRTRSHQEELVKRHHGKEAIGEEMQAGRRRFVTCSVSGSGPNSLQCPSISRFPELGEADNPGPAHATAKLFGEQSEATGQWATNLTNKSEMELTPLLAQVGKCRYIVQSESFEKEPYPYTSSVRKNIQFTNSHMDSFSLPCFYGA